MKGADAIHELEALLPGASVREVALLKHGLRADTYNAVVDGARVLAKRFRTLDGYAPNECMSYRLFASKGLDIAPRSRLIAPDNRWVVVDAVDGSDFIAALAAGDAPYSLMNRLGRTLATGIVATVEPDGTRATHERRRASKIRSMEADALLRRWPEVVRWVERFGIATDKTLDGVVASIVERYRNPPVSAWTQGDPAPSNVLFTATSALLVDFEYAAYRHALHDLVQWWVRIPLRYDWYARLEQIVGSTLIEKGVYQDEAAYYDDHAAMAAYAALYMFTWLPIEGVLDEDLPWAPGFDARSALLSTSNRLAARARSTYPVLSVWSERVFTALSRRWPAQRTGMVQWKV